MSLESTLRKEGIEVIKPFDTLKVNIVANRIAEKLCNAFPEHGFSHDDVFMKISRLSMYSAKFEDSLCGAKYFYKNNSIYFNADFPLENCMSFALHECIHYLQKIEDEKGELLALGLYDFVSGCGMAINEATVQLMTSEAFYASSEEVKYYGLDLNTPSPIYYPLECVIVKQMAYFTGTYPLYHSCLARRRHFQKYFCCI